jgi:hypothetical protein
MQKTQNSQPAVPAGSPVRIWLGPVVIPTRIMFFPAGAQGVEPLLSARITDVCTFYHYLLPLKCRRHWQEMFTPAGVTENTMCVLCNVKCNEIKPVLFLARSYATIEQLCVSFKYAHFPHPFLATLHTFHDLDIIYFTHVSVIKKHSCIMNTASYTPWDEDGRSRNVVLFSFPSEQDLQ